VESSAAIITRRGITNDDRGVGRIGANTALVYFRSISASSPEDDRPRRLVLLQIDQQLTEATCLEGTPELADPLDAVEVREAEDVEEFGASSRREGHEAGSEPSLHLVEDHEQTLVPGPSAAQAQGDSRTFADDRILGFLVELCTLRTAVKPCGRAPTALLRRVEAGSTGLHERHTAPTSPLFRLYNYTRLRGREFQTVRKLNVCRRASDQSHVAPWYVHCQSWASDQRPEPSGPPCRKRWQSGTSFPSSRSRSTLTFRSSSWTCFAATVTG
jgi:hypothetical protein